MKKLLLTLTIGLAMLAMAVPAMAAWEVKWQAATGATGYEVQYRVLSAAVWTTVDVGNVTTWTIPASWIKGTRYEIKCRGYTGPVATRSYGGDSDTIRWTNPADSVIVEMPDVPKQLIIDFVP